MVERLTTRLNIIAFLAGLSLFLASIEYLIPKPLPFFRIGIANIPLLLVLRHVRLPHILLLALLKVVGQAIVHGTLASYVFLFSFCGTFSSVLIMYLLSRIPSRYIGLVGISMAGALISNCVQMIFSVVFIFGSASWMIFLPFVVLGSISGGILGYISEHFACHSRWIAGIRDEYQSAR